MIRALPALVARHPRLAYVVAGDGALRPYLAELARSCGVAEQVVFTGRVDEETKAALLRGCRAFAMPSRASRAAAQFEGFGIVYIEAARAGRPAIAARAASADEVVTDGVTGILVDPDAPLSFAAGALTLLDDAALSDRLGAAARTRADANFTWEHATARLAAALAPVVA